MTSIKNLRKKISLQVAEYRLMNTTHPGDREFFNKLSPREKKIFLAKYARRMRKDEM